MKTKTTTAAELAAQIESAKAEIKRCEKRAAELENNGQVDDKTVNELTGLIAKTRLLTGSVKRLEAEHYSTLIQELEAQIPALTKAAEGHRRAAIDAAEKLTDQAAAILIPAADSTALWTAAYCERRRHEIAAFARQHTGPGQHTARAAECDAQLDRTRQQLRELKG